MKRASTVEKLTVDKIAKLAAYCYLHNCGVIVRIGGVEYGALLKYGVLFIELDSGLVPLRWMLKAAQKPMVRKGWEGLGGHSTGLAVRCGRPVSGQLEVCRQYIVSKWERC